MINKWMLMGIGWIAVVFQALQATAQVSINGVNYVNTYKALAIEEEQRSGVPASITLAQEVRRGEDVLARAQVRVAFISEGRAQPIPKALRTLLKADQG